MTSQFKSVAVAGIFVFLCSASPFTKESCATGFARDAAPVGDLHAQEMSSDAAIEAVSSYSLMFRVALVIYEDNEQRKRSASEKLEHGRDDARDETRTRSEQHQDETEDERDENDDSDPISDAIDTVLSLFGF